MLNKLSGYNIDKMRYSIVRGCSINEPALLVIKYDSLLLTLECKYSSFFFININVSISTAKVY